MGASMISVYWLIAGAVLLALEAFGLPGIGFLFAGIAAILVGALVEIGLIDGAAIVTQFGVFGLATVLFAVLLWKKLKSWRINPSAPHYHNMVGTEAVVTQELINDAIGEVRWSGALMRARLAEKHGSLTVGSTVIVRAMDGNVLLVAAK